MKQSLPALVFLLAALCAASIAQDEPTEPIAIDTVEKATVRLVLVDVVVLDRNNATVTGLSADDFLANHNHRPVEIDSVDDYCHEAAPEPAATRFARQRAPVQAPDGGRRIAFALDYQHIDWNQRNEVFDYVRKWIVEDMAEGDEVMIAALTGGVRVEQPFTSDRERVLQSMKRMEHDVTLWNGVFDHTNEIGWVNGMTSLLDVMGQAPGRKAMVLYSNMTDVPLDLQFDQIAAQAAAARTAIYPVDATGLRTRLGDAIRVPSLNVRAVGDG